MSFGPVPSTSTSSSGLASPIGDIIDENTNKVTLYLHQLAGRYEVEVDVIIKDHCYSRPWNWRPENVYVKPVKKLFFPKNNVTNDDIVKSDEDVDVEEGITERTVPPIDLTRARHVMDEFQRLANFARPDENDDWEEKIDKMLWSSVQSRIFTKVVRILNSERLARLAKSNTLTEPIFRRTSVDTAARRFRETLASASWDWRITQWLHSLLFDHLPQEYLAIYLDILQTLRLKIPQLVDKMITVQPNINSKGGSITWETLGSLLKRSWDPVASCLNNNRLKKLPGNPILIIAPSGMGTAISARQHKWISQLGALGMVVNVHTHLGLAANRMTMMVCIDQLVQATRAKIQDVRSDCPGRSIILIGFNTGAALACQVAQMEHVTAVICLGFPFLTVEGKRGMPDDTLTDIRCPVMFVIGQNAALVRPDDLEDLRQRMLVETSLVMVGTGDDYLRISTAKKISEGITQSMADRCILEEIGDFVGSILMQPLPLPLRPMSITNSENKNNKKTLRKRRNSTSSSVESEPNSPIVKKSRPNTPVTSTVSIGTNVASNLVSKTGSFNTQPTLVAVSGSHISHGSAIKRKPRVVNNQKTQFVEHLITSRLSGQSTSNSTNGGITLNIGSLASLSPIGPIRLAPTPTDQITTTSMKTPGTSKSSVASTKIQKIVSSNVPFQNVQKMKAIVSTTKGFSKVVTSNYRHTNIIDKNGDTKLVNVLTNAGNQIRVNPSPSTAMHNKSGTGTTSGPFSTLLHTGKSSMTLASNSSSTRSPSTSSILLTPNSSMANTVTAATTITKGPDDMESTCNSQHLNLNSIHSLDISKISQIMPQPTTSSNKDNSLTTSCGNVVMLTESSQNIRTVPSSVIVPFSTHNTGTILPLSNQLKVSHRSGKVIPKITLNTCNLQRIQRGRSQAALKKNVVNDIDDDLGNILDIPIIFAKDDDNLNCIEKVSSSTSHIPLVIDSKERCMPKLNNTTKVVLISNKHDKLQHNANKLVTPATQTIICPNVPVQNMNHVILQTRSQNAPVSTKIRSGIPIQSRPSQSTIKYTKIILAKRNSVQASSHQHDKSDQVILTKTTQRANAPKLCVFEKNEHKYAQAPKIYQDSFPDNLIEIEDAIKTNIIERKYVTIPEIDLTSPVKNNNTNRIVDESKLNLEDKGHSECTTFDDSAELQA